MITLPQNQLQSYLTLASRPSKKSCILKLHDEIERGEKDIMQLFEEYIWMPWGDLHAEPWNLATFASEIEKHVPPPSETITFPQMVEELQMSEQEQEMVVINQELAYLRDYRDEIRRKTVYLTHFVYEEIGKRFGVPYNELMFYTTPEIFGLFEGNSLSEETLYLRKGECVLSTKEGKTTMYYESGMEDFLKEVGFNDNVVSSQIKGLCACPGVITGPAKIIRTNKDLAKIENGDIMVAVTTHPDYIQKMHACRAIVTDEGGLSCHAAIVAREMQKPCVVGCGNATALLSDGNLVEVDAEKGVVKKI